MPESVGGILCTSVLYKKFFLFINLTESLVHSNKQMGIAKGSVNVFLIHYLRLFDCVITSNFYSLKNTMNLTLQFLFHIHRATYLFV